MVPRSALSRLSLYSNTRSKELKITLQRPRQSVHLLTSESLQFLERVPVSRLFNTSTFPFTTVKTVRVGVTEEDRLYVLSVYSEVESKYFRVLAGITETDRYKGRTLDSGERTSDKPDPSTSVTNRKEELVSTNRVIFDE